ncbi:1-acyl-sn-glycerol-3-phosphate acyltransferase 2 [Morella rubra]|uniref:1-acylglycerol-3-phosphate O-acyltransferase n=1 Tax=Morella rubra TaxID=262757 RepID=A0A6A1WF48_9ROSI|nr:1-acyl-sn-glycerol-3-phosphate acyltransferase 2 [Morella rubra]
MAVPGAAAVVVVGLVFVTSGLIVNIMQAIFFVLIRPLSMRTYRRISGALGELLWLELVFLMDWWARVKMQLYIDRETFQSMGKESALILCNHKSDIDWLVTMGLAQRAGILGKTIALMKSESKRFPSGLQQLEEYPRPFWLALFAEGTRFTPEKLLAAQEYAASVGLPIPRNVLIPRTKGFVETIRRIRSFVPAIYDITVAVPKGVPKPTMLGIFKGKTSVVDVRVKRYLTKDLPETDEGVAQWCRDLFTDKDAVLDKHIADNTFSDDELLDIGLSKKSFVVVAFWVCLLSFGTLKFLQWSALLQSWKGIGFSAFAVCSMTFVMHMLLQSTRSDLSTPAKLSSAKPKNGGEHPADKQN